MNIVPLSPITMVRAPGWPLDQTSALKPDGSLILSIGSLSAAGAIGGTGCGLRLASLLLFATLFLSTGLKPGGEAGAGVAAGGAGGCWADADDANNARLPARNNPRRHDH